MKQHTPGPWNFDGHGINHNGERIAKVCHGEKYDYFDGKPHENERFHADSLLIAAAPDLFNAAKKLILHYHLGNPHSKDYQALEKSIAKAEGKE